MSVLNHLEESVQRSEKRQRKEEVSILIGKAWPKMDSGFSLAPLTNPVQGKKGEFEIADIFPLVFDANYMRISFGLNNKCDHDKGQNTHWVFLAIEKDRLEDFKEACQKLGVVAPEAK
jgi:hypothetical protein